MNYFVVSPISGDVEVLEDPKLLGHGGGGMYVVVSPMEYPNLVAGNTIEEIKRVHFFN